MLMQKKQLVQYILLVYLKFNNLKREIWKQGDSKRKKIDLRKILNMPGHIKKAVYFVILTKHLR